MMLGNSSAQEDLEGTRCKCMGWRSSLILGFPVVIVCLKLFYQLKCSKIGTHVLDFNIL